VHVVVVCERHPGVPGAQLHPTIVAGATGAPVSTTVASRGNAAVHVPGHEISPPGLVTVPFPVTSTLNVACVHVGVPTPAAETKPEPETKLSPSFMLAVTFPVPQSLIAVTFPGPLNVTRFCESIDHCTCCVMSLLTGGCM